MARPGRQYQPLSEQQILRIHQASLTVLKTTEIQVENEEAKSLFQRGGAKTSDARVFLPPCMLEAALETVPSRLVLAGRDPAQDLVLEGKRVYAGTGGSPTMMLDLGADTVRPGVLRDLADLTMVADALEYCDFLAISLYPTNVPAEDVPVNRCYTCLRNSTKHVMSNVQGEAGSLVGLSQVIEMGTMIAGSLEAIRSVQFCRRSRAGWSALSTWTGL